MDGKKVSTDDCWLWAGSITDRGYGVVYASGIKPRAHRAHRAVYEALVGEIPKGLTIDHLCRVKLCINPDHLEPVTQGLNTKRKFGVDKCNRGHDLNDSYPATIKGLQVRICRLCHLIRRKQCYWRKIEQRYYDSLAVTNTNKSKD